MAGTFEVYEGTDPEGHHVLYGQAYDGNHRPAGQAFQITPYGVDAYGAVALTLDNGSVVVRYASPQPDPESTEDARLYVAEYTATGRLIDTADIGFAGDQSGFATFDPIAIGNNAYVALVRTVYSDFGQAEATDSLRYVDASGHAKTITLFREYYRDSPFPEQHFSDPIVKVLASGGFSVSYSASYEQRSAQFPITTPGAATYSATYDVSGNLVKSIFVNYGHETDLVTSSVSTVLSPSLYNLTLVGTADISGRGDALDNVIIGNAGKNHLVGAAGDDRLDGGLGTDYLVGGAGRDVFVFDTAIAPRWNADRIADFTHGVDKIELSSKIFTHLAAGQLAAADFSAVGSASAHGGAHILYDASGNLSYDPDGAGSAAPIVFAGLAGHPLLTASDFVVV